MAEPKDQKSIDFVKKAVNSEQFKSIWECSESIRMSYRNVAKTFFDLIVSSKDPGWTAEMNDAYEALKKFAKDAKCKAYHDVRVTYLSAKAIKNSRTGLTTGESEIF